MSNFILLIGAFKTSTMASKEKSDQYAFSKTVLYTKVTGSSTKTRKMEEEFKYGQMDQGMTDSGKMVWPMATEDWFTLKETSTRVNGKMTRPMVMEFTPISTEADTRDNGFKTSSTAWVLNSGQMVQSMKVCTSKA